MPISSSTFATDAASTPVIIAEAAVSEAPIPTQTAYEVPTGSYLMA